VGHFWKAKVCGSFLTSRAGSFLPSAEGNGLNGPYSGYRARQVSRWPLGPSDISPVMYSKSVNIGARAITLRTVVDPRWPILVRAQALPLGTKLKFLSYRGPFKRSLETPEMPTKPARMQLARTVDVKVSTGAAAVGDGGTFTMTGCCWAGCNNLGAG
jgi:hypothetical protein